MLVIRQRLRNVAACFADLLCLTGLRCQRNRATFGRGLPAPVQRLLRTGATARLCRLRWAASTGTGLEWATSTTTWCSAMGRKTARKTRVTQVIARPAACMRFKIICNANDKTRCNIQYFWILSFLFSSTSVRLTLDGFLTFCAFIFHEGFWFFLEAVARWVQAVPLMFLRRLSAEPLHYMVTYWVNRIIGWTFLRGLHKTLSLA